jgi:hypothetical protein
LRKKTNGQVWEAIPAIARYYRIPSYKVLKWHIRKYISRHLWEIKFGVHIHQGTCNENILFQPTFNSKSMDSATEIDIL